MIQNSLPTGLSIVSCATTAGSCSSSGAQVTINSLGAGESVTVTIVAQVDPTLSVGTVLETAASGASDEVNLDLSAATASASILIQTSIGPVVVGGSPASGSGASQMFTFQFSDPAGYQSFGVVNVLINTVLDGRHACYLAYSIPTSTLYLVDDAGDGGGPFAGGLVLGNSGTIQNGQCTVGLVSAVGNGPTLALKLNITFSSSFGGNLITYVSARDQGSGNSNWQPLGVWQVPFTPAVSIAVSSLTPGRGAGAAGTQQQFQLTVTDAKGVSDLVSSTSWSTARSTVARLATWPTRRRATRCTW